MLPATSAGTPAASNIAPSSAVVVVFPFVPVIPMIGFSSRRAPSSISEMTGMSRASAAVTGGACPGIPGLLTTRSMPSRSASSQVSEMDIGVDPATSRSGSRHGR